ncbi:MAG: NUDIX domain-containing protein, partial [Propionivibrio sp.]
MSAEGVAVTEVAAAILLRRNANGDGDGACEYLLARRPPGKVYAGYWEFPGGKVEPGESLHRALLRELHEELGIDIERAWPWLSCRFTYPHASVRLKFFRVVDWRGDIVPHEHDGIVWVRIGSAPPVAPVLPANGPILRALSLPAEYVLTNATANGAKAELERLQSVLNAGVRLLRIGDHALLPAQRLQFARQVITLAGDYRGARVLIADDEQLAHAVGADGVDLSSPRLMQVDRRPAFTWVAAS